MKIKGKALSNFVNIDGSGLQMIKGPERNTQVTRVLTSIDYSASHKKAILDTLFTHFQH